MAALGVKIPAERVRGKTYPEVGFNARQTLLGSYKVEMPILCSDGAKGAQGLTIGRLAAGQ